jgi:hypothetical protein
MIKKQIEALRKQLDEKLVQAPRYLDKNLCLSLLMNLNTPPKSMAVKFRRRAERPRLSYSNKISKAVPKQLLRTADLS